MQSETAQEFSLPSVSLGSGSDYSLAVTTSGSAALTATWSIIGTNDDYKLKYDGQFSSGDTGSITITINNSDGVIGQATTKNYEVLAPVAPVFVSNPTDFSFVVGNDEIYTFPAITDGSSTPTVLTVSINTISASDYTFDASAKTFKVHGSNNSVFDSLAGTTLTLTSTLSNNSV